MELQRLQTHTDPIGHSLFPSVLIDAPYNIKALIEEYASGSKLAAPQATDHASDKKANEAGAKYDISDIVRGFDHAKSVWRSNKVQGQHCATIRQYRCTFVSHKKRCPKPIMSRHDLTPFQISLGCAHASPYFCVQHADKRYNPAVHKWS